MATFKEAFEGLQASAEPYGFVAGGPRSEDFSYTHSLSKLEVDGGGIDPMVELEPMIEPQFEADMNGRDYHIATAFVTRLEDERNEAYVYTVTFSVLV